MKLRGSITTATQAIPAKRDAKAEHPNPALQERVTAATGTQHNTGMVISGTRLTPPLMCARPRNLGSCAADVGYDMAQHPDPLSKARLYFLKLSTSTSSSTLPPAPAAGSSAKVSLCCPLPITASLRSFLTAAWLCFSFGLFRMPGGLFAELPVPAAMAREVFGKPELA
eukprot:CAMPEP_0204495380 /NCGR_PEP_ID=MMETSP0471-20130131/86312_1 /ASSEMBLY_ACC=CAM_ASM_000602 /TAXON_ID=2969 /ORGANISM="Oxyrrhis marina" /LENGTH=168 /DNA_ID=CAMNT_0051499629 /DNA_START=136 /DNA_END=639 /DNA_ORIENTATION=+